MEEAEWNNFFGNNHHCNQLNESQLKCNCPVGPANKKKREWKITRSWASSPSPSSSSFSSCSTCTCPSSSPPSSSSSNKEKITPTGSSWSQEKWSMKKIIIVKILLLISQCTTVVLCLSTDCDQMFVSTPDGLKNGTFVSPVIENNNDHHSRQCIYTFVAAENERVELTFNSFNLRGAHPECNHEYMDIYTELEDLNQDLINSPFGGRYCGRILPRKRVSLHQVIVIGFYTDQTSVSADTFTGTFEFIDASPYVAGTPMPMEGPCSFTILVDQKREGQFRSPTYPGVYPKNLQCQYRFIGRKGQRVRLEFMDFDLFYGGSHCPFDYIKVYDGSSSDDPLIGPYCGPQRNLLIYSSGENLFVQFITLQRTADSQNRGFAGWFEFSERFVNLGFIGKNDGEHIRGTECDQKILSRKESNGTIYSPNYPFLYHTNIVCKYFIYGLQDVQHLETVRLEFEKFEIPSSDPNECTDAYVRIYLSGESLDEPDHIYCGTEAPAAIVSDGPILIMVFSSGTSQGQGFKGRYFFETDYKVPGTPDPPGCRFKYLSESVKAADFNSPRHPSNYPSSTDCLYEFYGQPGEQIKVVFNYFRMKSESSDSVIGYNEACSEDWIEIYQVSPSGREYKFGRFCGSTAPGPIVTDFGVNSMRILFRTDESGVASGFSASYQFLPAMTSLGGDPASRGCPGAVVRIWKNLAAPPIELCGEGLSNETRQFISSTEMLRLSFITADKAVGSGGFKATWTEIKDPTPVTSTNATSISSPGQVACNTNPPVLATSNSNAPQIHYLQHEFRCLTNQYCISAKLKCNGIHNCGKYDDSDEANCIKSREMVSDFLLTGLIAGASMFVCVIFCSICRRRRRIKRKRASISSINGGGGNGTGGGGGGTSSIMHPGGGSAIHPSGSRRRSSCSSLDFNPVTYCTGHSGRMSPSSGDPPLLSTSLTVNCPPPPPPPAAAVAAGASSNLISVSSSSSLAAHVSNCPGQSLSTAPAAVINNTMDSLDGQMYSHTLPHAHSHHQLHHPVYHHHHHHHHTLHHPHPHLQHQQASAQHSLQSLSGGNLLMSMETESSSPSPPTPNTTVIAMSTKTQPQPLLSSHSHSLSFGGSIHDGSVHDVPGIFDLPPPLHPSSGHQGGQPPHPPPPSVSLAQLDLQSAQNVALAPSPSLQYQPPPPLPPPHGHSHVGSLICLAPDSAAGSVLPSNCTSNCNDGNGTGHTPGSLTHATTTYIPADSL